MIFFLLCAAVVASFGLSFIKKDATIAILGIVLSVAGFFFFCIIPSESLNKTEKPETYQLADIHDGSKLLTYRQGGGVYYTLIAEKEGVIDWADDVSESTIKSIKSDGNKATVTVLHHYAHHWWSTPWRWAVGDTEFEIVVPKEKILEIYDHD